MIKFGLLYQKGCFFKMSDDFSQFLNYFRSHLNEIKKCDEKIDDILAETKTAISSLEKEIKNANENLTSLFDEFELSLPKIDLNQIEKESQKCENAKKLSLFIQTKKDEQSSPSQTIKSNVAKLNLLLEAVERSKFFITSRVPKVVDKFEGQVDVSELFAISKTATKIFEDQSKIICKTNAKAAIVLAKEIEARSKMQTLEAILQDLKKRLSNIA